MIKIHMNINRRQKYVWTSDSSGFTLVEVIVYIAIFSMIAVTLISLAIFRPWKTTKRSKL